MNKPVLPLVKSAGNIGLKLSNHQKPVRPYRVFIRGMVGSALAIEHEMAINSSGLVKPAFPERQT